MKAVPLLGCLLFILLTVKNIADYGKQWDLSGRYHMPTTLLAPNGETYRDGTPIDDVTKMCVDRGIEQEVWLVALGVILILSAIAVWRMRRSYRRQLEAVDVELRRIYRMPPVGGGGKWDS
jgi:hypothetical protein